VNLLFRTALLFLRARRRSKLHVHDVARTPFRVLPSDLDVLGHMNNGVYFSIMDLGRMDLMIRAGVWATLTERGFYPVVTKETISFRKSLQPWQRFVLESRIVGYDDRAVYIEQRFVVGGEIFARAYMCGRFLKKAGGTVSVTELVDALGIDPTEVTLPKWLTGWSDEMTLPTTRAHAPSDW
jgi:acyl-CoA thioesterase FadM